MNRPKSGCLFSWRVVLARRLRRHRERCKRQSCNAQQDAEQVAQCGEARLGEGLFFHWRSRLKHSSLPEQLSRRLRFARAIPRRLFLLCMNLLASNRRTGRDRMPAEGQNFGSAIGAGRCRPTRSHISGISFHVRLVNGTTRFAIFMKGASRKSSLLMRSIEGTIDITLHCLSALKRFAGQPDRFRQQRAIA